MYRFANGYLAPGLRGRSCLCCVAANNSLELTQLALKMRFVQDLEFLEVIVTRPRDGREA